MIKSGANKLDQELIRKMAAGEYDEKGTKFDAKRIAKMLGLTEKTVKSFITYYQQQEKPAPAKKSTAATKEEK